MKVVAVVVRRRVGKRIWMPTTREVEMNGYKARAFVRIVALIGVFTSSLIVAAQQDIDADFVPADVLPCSCRKADVGWHLCPSM